MTKSGKISVIFDLYRFFLVKIPCFFIEIMKHFTLTAEGLLSAKSHAAYRQFDIKAGTSLAVQRLVPIGAYIIICTRE